MLRNSQTESEEPFSPDRRVPRLQSKKSEGSFDPPEAMSVRVSPAGWGARCCSCAGIHDLAVVIEGVGDAEFGAMQGRRPGLAHGLQHVVDGQDRRGFVTLGERVFQELRMSALVFILRSVRPSVGKRERRRLPGHPVMSLLRRRTFNSGMLPLPVMPASRLSRRPAAARSVCSSFSLAS